MLAMVLFVGVASGSPATDYIDAQMGVDAKIAALQINYTAAVLVSQPDYERSMADVQLQARGLVEQAGALSEWPGSDQGLSAAVAQRAEHGVLWFEQTLPTMISLESGAHPRDADQLQFETLLHLSELTEQQDLDRINDALAAFALANRVLLEDPPDRFLDPPELELDLPGHASALPSLVRVNFAVAHNNEMVLVHDKLLDVWDVGVDLEPQARADHQQALAAAVAAVQAVPPWMGDDTLTSALSANGDQLLELYGLMLQISELELRVFLFGKKRRQHDQLIDQVNDALEPMSAKVAAAWTDFETGWKMDAVAEHLEALAEWAQAQQALL